MAQAKASRRRGEVLEEAILEAAWAELAERGYSGTTLERVARRAGTSRPVLHRRWKSRLELAAAAMARHFAQNPIEVPDLGSVREELAMLLRKLSDRGAPTMLRLMLAMNEDLVRERSNLLALKSRLAVDGGATEEILQRGIDRGEIDPDRITPRIASLPKDLLRHEVIMTFDGVSDFVIYEILDQVFLPLVAPVDREP
ncbi:TetR/AcrR family transcriptional regulator [Sphingomonas sp. DT-204]|uniref:TetR/AcrR family transcriptional regulator n=1 Tax=Sphingomonas sp. DT-204 TaxID=3396166 RepID=UPI003F1A7F78